MRFQMSLTVANLPESLATHSTTVWSPICMNDLVSTEKFCSSKTLATPVTEIQLNFRMQTLVRRELRLKLEGQVTYFAAEQPLYGVQLHVLVEGALREKALLAVATHEGTLPLSRVHSHDVRAEGGLPPEGLATLVTNGRRLAIGTPVS